MEDPDTLTALFRRHGLKVTRQRQCIFEILYANPAHSTAEAIYAIAKRRMPSISLKTVYEILHSLAALGQIHQIDLGTGSTHFDTDIHHHHHLVCSKCKSIADIDEKALGTLPKRKKLAGGFLVERYAVDVIGLCSKCQ